MSQAGETFFVSVGCMDGRVQGPIAAYGKQKFGVLFPDTITEAGIVGLLAKEEIPQYLTDGIIFKVFTVSAGMHHAKGIVVHGHQECAGNPVPDEQHKQDILKAAEKIKALMPKEFSLPIVPVFVKRDGTNWVVEEL